MNKILDILFFWSHIVIILFNLFGWIWSKTRKAHLWVISLTIFSWLILGLRYGLGYCFLTDWHWDVKRKLGESGMPASFIKYFLDEYTSITLAAGAVDWITAIAFILVVMATVYVNFIKGRFSQSGFGTKIF
jgi:hypothetical protein